MKMLYNHLLRTSNKDPGPPQRAVVETTMSKLSSAIDFPRATCYFLIGKLKELGVIATEKHRTGHVGAAGTRIVILRTEESVQSTKQLQQIATQAEEPLLHAAPNSVGDIIVDATETCVSSSADVTAKVPLRFGLIQARMKEVLQNPSFIYQIRAKSGVYDDDIIRNNAYEFANQLEMQGKDESGINLALHYGYWLGIKNREQQKRRKYENINDQERRRSAETQQWCNDGMSGSIKLFGDTDDKPIPF